MNAPSYKIAILPGDGIGPEVTNAATEVLKAVAHRQSILLELSSAPVGGAAFDLTGSPLPAETLAIAKAANAVLLGAVGGPKWESVDRSLRPERALLALRQALGVFANLRPVQVFSELAEASSLKPHLVTGVNLLVVRELIGDIYFGQPRGLHEEKGRRVGMNTMVYHEDEIIRVARVAFGLAKKRKGRVCSVDKANVLETSELWRTVVTETAREFSDVTLSHMYVDNAAMQILRAPLQFDVILTGNLFGDILSDEAAMLTGSIGMLPSASLNESQKGLYEPIHGSAPEMAGLDMANPLATILSVAMMFRHSLNQPAAALQIEAAVENVLSKGYRTHDLWQKGNILVGTSEMGLLVANNL